MKESLFLTLIAGADAHGGGAEAHGIDWLLVLSLFTNVILLFGFLIWRSAPAVSKALKARRANMAVDLERAQKKQAEAEARLAEYEAKLENLEQEVANIMRSYEREAESDRKKLEDEAAKTVARLQRETKFTIQQEGLKAEKRIRQAAVDSTLLAAENLVRQKIEPSDHERLVQQYVEQLGNGQPS